MRWYSVLALAFVALAPSLTYGQPAPTPPPAEAADSTPVRLAYVMVFVTDMKRSVAFYRDQLGLRPRFASPDWSEFDTGQTILALHPAGPHNPAGTSEIGVTVADLNAFYAERKAAGVAFSEPPERQHYGSDLAEMRDPDGAAISIGGR